MQWITIVCAILVAFANPITVTAHQSGVTAQTNRTTTIPNTYDPATETILIDTSDDSISSSSNSLSSSRADGTPYSCQWTSPDGTNFDFSPLTTASGVKVTGSQSDVYVTNVCGVAATNPPANPDVCVAASATVCFQFSWSPDWFSLALLDGAPAPTVALITPGTPTDGVVMTFTNGKYGPNDATVIMQFICEAGATTNTYQGAHDTQFEWTITITSASCCPLPPASSSSGLSGGWVFIIILLCVGVVYVVGGCAYKHYRIGTQGMESCPNVDFWRELPGLVKDGCIFFILKCKEAVARCQGKTSTGGGTSGGYEDLK